MHKLTPTVSLYYIIHTLSSRHPSSSFTNCDLQHNRAVNSPAPLSNISPRARLNQKAPGNVITDPAGNQDVPLQPSAQRRGRLVQQGALTLAKGHRTVCHATQRNKASLWLSAEQSGERTCEDRGQGKRSPSRSGICRSSSSIFQRLLPRVCLF